MRKNKIKISFLFGLIFLGSALISRIMATFQRAVEFDETEVRHLLKLSKFSSEHGGQALKDREVNYWLRHEVAYVIVWTKKGGLNLSFY